MKNNRANRQQFKDKEVGIPFYNLNTSNMNSIPHHNHVSKGLRIINDKPDDNEKKTVAVIVTFCNAGSYDPLFTTVEQKALEGTKVEVYACDSFYLENMINAFQGKPTDQVAVRMMKSISEVDPDCVVLNWECCGGYASKQFQEGPDKLFYFLKKVINRGHMAMFSDFSLKALVKNWHDKYELGPNPFVETGGHTGNFQVKFSPAELKECPSAQLQIIGDMVENGTCNVLAAGGTIVYSVNSERLNHQHYKLQVLTVVPTIKPPSDNLVSKIGEHKGSAGHVLLIYPSGGMILTSMGHWVELMKIDTSADKIFEVAEMEYGLEKANMMRAEWSNMNQVEQKNYVTSNAMQFVRNQAPCSNMNRNARRKM